MYLLPISPFPHFPFPISHFFVPTFRVTRHADPLSVFRGRGLGTRLVLEGGHSKSRNEEMRNGKMENGKWEMGNGEIIFA